jgi:SAM-dependent methyltransferase
VHVTNISTNGLLPEDASVASGSSNPTDTGGSVVTRQLDVNDNHEVYYQGSYWNNLDCTQRMINGRISGDDGIGWWQHFAKRSNRSFNRGLFLNCGNGWVEREMVEAGFVKEAVGIDYSTSLLDEARSAAGSLPIRYEQVNINVDELPGDEFDLVVNMAAAHHITMIDRVFRDLCTILPEDGWFISFDYVGPHRDQYLPEAWDTLWKLNMQLPEEVRQTLSYPYLPLMLVFDPTEGVHSELILPVLHRYFNVDEFAPLGGAIAYPILTFNSKLFALPDAQEREKWGQFVLDQDAEYLASHPESTLFAYFTAQPNKSVLQKTTRLAMWQQEEEEREARAASNGGEYFQRSAFHDAYEDLSLLQQANADLRLQLETIQSSFLYSRVNRILAAPFVRRFVGSAVGSKLIGLVKRS